VDDATNSDQLKHLN